VSSPLVGSVHVDVKPSARDFVKDIRQQILGQIDELGKEIGERVSKGITKPIADAVSEGLEDGVDNADTKGKAAKKGKETGGAFAKGLKAELEAALQNLPDIDLNLNDDEIFVEIEAIRKRIQSLKDATIGVDVSGEHAVAEIEAIREELRRLGKDADVEVRFDLNSAAAGLAGFEAKVRETAARSSGAFADTFRTNLSAALKNLPEVEITVDSAGTFIEIEAIRQRITSLQDARIGVDITGEEALVEIAAIREALLLLNDDANIDLRFDVNSVLSSLEGLDQNIRDTANRSSSAFAQAFRSNLQSALKNLPEITIPASLGEAQLSTIRKQIADLGNQRIGVDLSAAEALAKIAALRAALLVLRDESSNVDLKFDIQSAISSLDALPQALEQALARNQGVFADQFKSSLESALTSLPDIQLGLDPTRVNADLAIIRAEIERLSGQKIGVDLDNASALAQIEFLRGDLLALRKDASLDLQFNIDKALTSLRGFTDEARQVADQASGVFAQTFRDKIKGLVDTFPEIKLKADATEAEKTIAEVQVRLLTLSDKTIGVHITAEDAIAEASALEAVLRSLPNDIPIDFRSNAVKVITELAALRAAAAGVEGDFNNIGAAIDSTVATSANAGTQIAGHMSHIQMIALAVAAAFPFIAAAILGVVGAVSLIATPIAAVVVGLDGIKKAAAPLAPLFTQLKTQVSAVFEQTLGTAISNVAKLFPVITAGLTGMARQLSLFAGSVTAVLSSTQNLSTIAGTFTGVQALFATLAPSAELLTQNLVDLANIGVQGLAQLAPIMTQVGQVWKTTIASLASTGIAQQAIGALFQVLGSLLTLIAPLTSLGAILLTTFGPPIAAAINLLSTILGALAAVLTGLPAPVTALVTAFLGMKAIGAVISAVKGNTDQLKTATDGASASGTRLGTAFNAGKTALGALGTAYATGATAAQNFGTKVTASATTAAASLSGPLSKAVSGAGKTLTGLGAVATGVGATITKGIGGAVSGLVGALGGPWGLAITGAIAVLSLLGQKQQEAAAAAQAHQTAISSLAEALRASNGQVTAAIAEQKALEFAHSAGAAAADKMGISSANVLDAITQGGPAYDQLVAQLKASADEYANNSAAQIQYNRDGTAVASTLQTQDNSARTLLDTLTGMRGEFTAAADENAKLAAALRQAGTSMVSGVGAAKAIADGIKVLGDNSATTSERVKALQDVMANLFTGLGAEQAAAALNKSISDIGPAFAKAKEEANGLKIGLLNADGTIRTTTESGRALLSTALEMGQNMQASALQAFDAAGGYSNLGVATAAAHTAAQGARDAFIKAAGAVGINATAAGQLADHYGLIPSVVETLIATRGMPQVQQELIQIQGLLDRTKVGTTINVGVISQPAIAALQAVGLKVTTLPNGTVDVTVTDAAGRTKLDKFIADATAKTATPNVVPKTEQALTDAQKLAQTITGIPIIPSMNVNPQPAKDTAQTAIDGIVKTPATLPVEGNPAPVDATVDGVRQNAAGTPAVVNLTVNVVQANADINGFISGLGLKPAVITVTVAFATADQGVTAWITALGLKPAVINITVAFVNADLAVTAWIAALGLNVGAILNITLSFLLTDAALLAWITALGLNRLAILNITLSFLLTDAALLAWITALALRRDAILNITISFILADQTITTWITALGLKPAVLNVTTVFTAADTALTAFITKVTTTTTAILKINADPKPATDVVNKLVSDIQALKPLMPVDANTQPAIDTINALIQQIESTTVTLNVQVAVSGGVGGAVAVAQGAYFMANGGALNAPRPLRPMAANKATVVQPNAWRVIGDRAHGAEAFIPMNGSARSLAILAQAAQGMGRQVVPMASGGVATQQTGSFQQALSSVFGKDASATNGDQAQNVPAKDAPMIGTLNLTPPPGASAVEYSDEIMFALRHYRHGGLHDARVG